MSHRCTVLIFSGHDPSGGAGITADICAVQAIGAHPLSVITTLTVQDNNRVVSVHPVSTELLAAQSHILTDSIEINAVKIGLMGSLDNALNIIEMIQNLRDKNPNLPVVLDPVLMSGRGNRLTHDNMAQVWPQLYPLVTVLTPNLIEAAQLSGEHLNVAAQAQYFINQGVTQVLIKGGHGAVSQDIINIAHHQDGTRQKWQWPRLQGEFHGSGCTLAAAIAAYLALGYSTTHALNAAQIYCQHTLTHAYAIAAGQLIPNRN